jgi:hypothetical protein
MAETRRFQATIVGTPRGGGGQLVEIPPEVIEDLGGKGRIPVNATFNGVPYRGSIVRMGGVAVLGILKSTIERLGVDVGDRIDVTVELDTAERTVDVPEDLAAAMAKDTATRAAWDGLSFTRRKELARGIEEAKRSETRERRLQAALDELRSRAR